MMLLGAENMVAAGSTIPLIPGETMGERFQLISQAVLGGTNAAAFSNVIAVGWTTGQAEAVHVDGALPRRSDTNLIVQSLPLQLSTGTLAIGAGTLPARIAGADQDFQIGAGEGGISLAPDSNAVFVAKLPTAGPTYRIQPSSLTVVASSFGAGIALSGQTAAIWDWTTSRWTPVDITSGQITVHNPARFFDAAGVVRIRMSAQTASLNISSPSDGVAVGVTGRVAR
jgi:hypothetical protein